MIQKKNALGHERDSWKPDKPDFRDDAYRYGRTLFRGLSPAVTALWTSPAMPAVVDQGAEGSCTANALAAAVSFARAALGAPIEPRSRQFIYYNERAWEGNAAVDGGAELRDGIKTLAQFGAPAETSWPYETDMYKRPTWSVYDEAVKYRITGYHRIDSWAEAVDCLAQGFPFVFGFTCYDAIDGDAVAHSGYLSMPKATDRVVGGHAVLGCGHGTVADFVAPEAVKTYALDPAEEVLLCRNSWSDRWGVRGYFVMPQGYASSRDLADDFWTVRA